MKDTTYIKISLGELKKIAQEHPEANDALKKIYPNVRKGEVVPLNMNENILHPDDPSRRIMGYDIYNDGVYLNPEFEWKIEEPDDARLVLMAYRK